MRYFKKNPEGFTLRRHMARIIDTAVRTAILMLFAVPFAAALVLLWYFGSYKTGFHFLPTAENISVASWVPFLGVLFVFVLTMILSTAWSKDSALNDAIHSYDVDAFMRLRATHLHPLAYAMLYLVAGIMFVGFAAIDYPDAWSGFIIVGSIAYLISFTPFVLGEIDKPLSGVWFVKNVPLEWIAIDPKTWFRQTREERRTALLATLKKKEEDGGTFQTQ